MMHLNLLVGIVMGRYFHGSAVQDVTRHLTRYLA